MSQPRALLVVESPGLELFYRHALAGAGFEVFSVRSAETALAQLRVAPPVIVVLDVPLRGTSGVEFIGSLRAQCGAASPPVVVLPVLDAELAAAAAEAGASRVLTREQSPLRTLTLIAHTHARLHGAPAAPLPPRPSEWVPFAVAHDVALREALRELGRGTDSPEIRRRLAAEAHGLAEMLHLAGEAGLAELASTIEMLVLARRDLEGAFTQSMLQTIGQAADFLGARFSEFSPGAAPSARGSRVLVVDDEPMVCQLVSVALNMCGVEPHTADSPSACLGAVQKAAFDLVILDIGLPEMSGFDLCTHIRNCPPHETVPILFLTGLTTFQNRAKSVLIGGNDFICKPFDPLELGLKVLLWIQLCRAARRK